MGTATAGFQHLLSCLQSSHAKVSNLDRGPSAVKEKVLGLQITVTNAECMAIVHTKDNLAEVHARLVRRQSAPGHQEVKELATSHILHDQEKLLTRLIHIPEAQQIRVLNELHDHDLTLDAQRKLILLCTEIAEAHAAINEHLLRNNLHGRHLLRARVYGQSHTT